MIQIFQPFVKKMKQCHNLRGGGIFWLTLYIVALWQCALGDPWKVKVYRGCQGQVLSARCKTLQSAAIPQSIHVARETINRAEI